MCVLCCCRCAIISFHFFSGELWKKVYTFLASLLSKHVTHAWAPVLYSATILLVRGKKGWGKGRGNCKGWRRICQSIHGTQNGQTDVLSLFLFSLPVLKLFLYLCFCSQTLSLNLSLFLSLSVYFSNYFSFPFLFQAIPMFWDHVSHWTEWHKQSSQQILNRKKNCVPSGLANIFGLFFLKSTETTLENHSGREGKNLVGSRKKNILVVGLQIWMSFSLKRTNQ